MKFVLKFKNAKGKIRYAKGLAMLIRFPPSFLPPTFPTTPAIYISLKGKVAAARNFTNPIYICTIMQVIIHVFKLSISILDRQLPAVLPWVIRVLDPEISDLLGSQTSHATLASALPPAKSHNQSRGIISILAHLGRERY